MTYRSLVQRSTFYSISIIFQQTTNLYDKTENKTNATEITILQRAKVFSRKKKKEKKETCVESSETILSEYSRRDVAARLPTSNVESGNATIIGEIQWYSFVPVSGAGGRGRRGEVEVLKARENCLRFNWERVWLRRRAASPWLAAQYRLTNRFERTVRDLFLTSM